MQPSAGGSGSKQHKYSTDPVQWGVAGAVTQTAFNSTHSLTSLTTVAIVATVTTVTSLTYLTATVKQKICN